MKNKYYVYILKTDNGIPFYIGKGSGGRIFDHVVEAKRNKINNLKLNLIRSILNKGGQIEHIFYRKNLSKNKAIKIEQFLINKYGKVIDNTGTLTNSVNSISGANSKYKPSFNMQIRKFYSKYYFPITLDDKMIGAKPFYNYPFLINDKQKSLNNRKEITSILNSLPKEKILYRSI